MKTSSRPHYNMGRGAVSRRSTKITDADLALLASLVKDVWIRREDLYFLLLIVLIHWDTLGRRHVLVGL